MNKYCYKCKTLKSSTDFYKNKAKKDNLTSECKKCHKLLRKKEYLNNSIKIKQRVKQWALNNSDKMSEYSRRYYSKHTDKHRERVDKWIKENYESRRKWLKTWLQNRRKTDLKANLDHRMEVSINKALKGMKRNRTWESLVDYTCEDLVSHLKEQFKDDMTWDKFLQGKIHIDHIKPRILFNYKKPEDPEFKVCWALKNLQPLWAEDNLKKGSKYNGKN